MHGRSEDGRVHERDARVIGPNGRVVAWIMSSPRSLFHGTFEKPYLAVCMGRPVRFHSVPFHMNGSHGSTIQSVSFCRILIERVRRPTERITNWPDRVYPRLACRAQYTYVKLPDRQPKASLAFIALTSGSACPLDLGMLLR